MSQVSQSHHFSSTVHRMCRTFGRLSSIQLLSCVRLFATPWTAALQASLSITSSRSLPKLMCIELVMPSNHPSVKCPSQGPNQTDTLLLKSLPGLAARAAAGERAVSCTKARQKGAATPRRSTGQALAHPQENGTLLHFSERAPGLVMSRGTDENRCSLVEQHSLVKEFMTWLCPHSPPRFPPSHHIRPPSSPLAPASPYAVCSARRAPAFYPCIFPGSA